MTDCPKSCCSRLCCHCCMTDSDEDEDYPSCSQAVKKMKEKKYKQLLPESSSQHQGKHAAVIHEIILPEFHKVPLDKVFHMTQPQAPLPIHPQMRHSSVDIVDNGGYQMYRRRSHIETSWFISVPISCKQPALDESELALPLLRFNLIYSVQSFSLTVGILSVDNLPTKDYESKTPNPFVMAFLLPHREEIFRSKTHHNTFNPIINEEFVFTNISYEEISQRTLVLRVIDENKFHHNVVMGSVVLPLRSMELHGVQISAVLNESDDTDSTQFSSNGEVQLILKHDPSMNEVNGMVIKASNLKRNDIFGLSDTHVEVTMYYNGKKQYKWKSSVVKNTLSPCYNEYFRFDVTDMKMSDVVMKLLVKDRGLLGKDDFMGMVELGEHVDHETGRTQWRNMIANPNTRITNWHSLDQYTVGIFNLS